MTAWTKQQTPNKHQAPVRRGFFFLQRCTFIGAMIRYAFLLTLACLVMATVAFAQRDTTKCYATCRFAPVYKIDTVKVMDVPSHRKSVRIPEVYEITVDTIVDEAASKLKRYPPTYEVSTNKRGESTYKRIDDGEQSFYLTKKTIPVEQKKLVAHADVSTVEVPPSYVTVYEKKLDSHQPVEQEVEIVCEQNVKPELIVNVRRALAIRGYKSGLDTGQADRLLMEALENFQSDNGLPLCGFNVMTLQFLGIDVP